MPPLGAYCFLTMSSPLRCFSLSYYGFLPLGASSPFTSMPSCSFYSKLIRCNFSLLLLGLHQLFLACCGHSFRIAHQSIGCLATTSAQNMFAAPLLISWKNSILFVLAVYLHVWVQMDNDWTTLPPTSMACIKWS